jgi:hypothetical protein
MTTTEPPEEPTPDDDETTQAPDWSPAGDHDGNLDDNDNPEAGEAE